LSQAINAAPNQHPVAANGLIYNKIARRILPILFFGYIIAYSTSRPNPPSAAHWQSSAPAITSPST
jgi:hypothetical protein